MKTLSEISGEYAIANAEKFGHSLDLAEAITPEYRRLKTADPAEREARIAAFEDSDRFLAVERLPYHDIARRKYDDLELPVPEFPD